jgi:hypothetical protein
MFFFKNRFGPLFDIVNKRIFASGSLSKKESDMKENKTEFYNRLVNAKWPSPLPVPSDQEAITGAKRLYRKAMGRPWKGEVKVTSGNRATWVRRGTLYVNPNESGRGWQEIIHSISHLAHLRLNPRDKPHTSKQAYIERDLTDYAMANGFLTGALKSKVKPKVKKDDIIERHERLMKRETGWETKLNRAQNALKKIQKERRAYERRHKDRIFVK